MQKCLSIFDVSGIQEYLFRSSKLKENLGASLLVAEAMDEKRGYLQKAIERVCPGRNITAWRDQSEFVMLHDSGETDAEIIYTGGGNAMVAFLNEAIAIDVTHELSLLLWEHAPNLEFCVAHLKTDFRDFQHDREKLFGEKLLAAKNSTIRSPGLLGISITRQCPQTGLPAVEKVREDNKDIWICAEAFSKRKKTGFLLTDESFSKLRKTRISDDMLQKIEPLRNEEYLTKAEFLTTLEDILGKDETRKYKSVILQQTEKLNDFDRLLTNPGKYKFPLDIDSMGQITGESHIAVVHIDGNNMGKRLNDVLSGIDDCTAAVKTMRDYAKKVSDTYRETLKETITLIEKNSEEHPKTQKYYCPGNIKRVELKKDPDDGRVYLPIRPILCDGDDITFVTDGRLGISIAETFLKKLSEKTLTLDGKPLSACAGVAIVKTRFPFYRAYRLAEELCTSAKRKAKNLFPDGDIGSWLDFQIIFSGVTTNLQTLRARQYNVPGMDAPQPIDDPKGGGFEYPLYNLCSRPWCVSATDNEDYDWEKLKGIYNVLSAKWPRSKLKDLRAIFLTDETQIKIFLQEAKSRDNRLPEFRTRGRVVDPETGFDKSRITPYFDALELLDFFIEMNTQEAL